MDANANSSVIAFLLRVKGLHLWALIATVTIACAVGIVSIMSWLLKGEVAWDYILTGLVTAAIVAPLSLAVLTQLLNALASVQEELVASRLAQTEERFRLLFEHSPFGLTIVTPDYRLAEVNPAFCALLGYTAAELRDKTFLDITHPDDQALDLAHRVDLFGGKTTHYTLEKRYVHKDGHAIWANLIGTVIRNQRGKALYALGIVEDITARHEAERLRIEQLEHQRDVLVREVHHRIKNNLQGVISLIDQLKRKQPLAADALEEAAGQISTIAVVYGLHSHPRSTEVSPRQLIEAIVAAIVRLSTTPIECRPGNEISEWEWRLNARDTVSIALIINELIYNAIKHAGAEAHVEVSYGSESGAFSVRVFNHPASLPPGFDFAAGNGHGTGLSLVTSLLPPQGARLTIKPLHDGVEAVLHLTHPCVTATPPPPKESLQ